MTAGRSSDGRDVWQLTQPRATVVKPDPLAKAGPGVLGHDAVRADRATLFAPVMS